MSARCNFPEAMSPCCKVSERMTMGAYILYGA